MIVVRVFILNFQNCGKAGNAGIDDVFLLLGLAQIGSEECQNVGDIRESFDFVLFADVFDFVSWKKGLAFDDAEVQRPEDREAEAQLWFFIFIKDDLFQNESVLALPRDDVP